MTAYDFFLFAAASYGITYGLKDSKLLSYPRNYLADRSSFFLELIQCPYCTGFHSGWLSFLLVFPLDVFTFHWWTLLIAHAFAGVLISGFLDYLLLRLEASVRSS